MKKKSKSCCCTLTLPPSWMVGKVANSEMEDERSNLNPRTRFVEKDATINEGTLSSQVRGDFISCKYSNKKYYSVYPFL